MKSYDVIVIGAGWAGLSAAGRLRDAGLRVVVIEKGRGPGGRCATRRQDGFGFDHGAQYFTARSPAFQRVVDAWRTEQLIAPWTPRIRVFGARPGSPGSTPTERWVGIPGMNSVLSDRAAQLDCRFSQRVDALDYGDQWVLNIEGGQKLAAQSLVLTAPPAQAAALLGQHHPFAAILNQVPMQPTWALMVGFDSGRDAVADPFPDPGFDGAFDNEGPLSWLARNSSKPGRSGQAWVAHASVEWSREHLEADRDWVAEQLFFTLCHRLGIKKIEPSLLTAHRWRYAQCETTIEKGCLWQADQGLAVAGDWCAGNRVEGAWTSGQAAAQRIESALRGR